MKTQICILVGFAVGFWIVLIAQHQEKYSSGVDISLYKAFKAKCDQFFKVCKNLKTVETLVSKTEKDIKSYDFLSPRREKFQNNLKKLENKQVDLKIRYNALVKEIDQLFFRNEKEIYSEKNQFDINAIRIKDLYKIYMKYREEMGI